jgi:hypothetical protein
MPNVKNLMNSDSDVQRRRRYRQMEMEEKASDKLRKEGWEVFSPTVVCDRIAIKDGKVFLIEFKKPEQSLTESQDKIKKLVRNYRVVYY